MADIDEVVVRGSAAGFAQEILAGFGASLTQPIFTGGRLRSEVRLAEARKQTAVLFY
jgi:outer membrane protein TolC